MARFIGSKDELEEQRGILDKIKSSDKYKGIMAAVLVGAISLGGANIAQAEKIVTEQGEVLEEPNNFEDEVLKNPLGQTGERLIREGGDVLGECLKNTTPDQEDICYNAYGQYKKNNEFRDSLKVQQSGQQTPDKSDSQNNRTKDSDKER